MQHICSAYKERELTIYPHETILREARGGFGKPYALVEVAEGEEVAGAGMRHVSHCWRVVSLFDGKRHSHAFKTLEEAQRYFEQWTNVITEERA